MLTSAEARELFLYDRATGVLTWRVSPTPKVKVGDVARSKAAGGYLCVRIKRKPYRVHRVILLMENGVWPPAQVDHLNHIRTDNRISNLRCATRQENAKNLTRRRDNTSGHVGVCWDKNRSKWFAQLSVNRKHIFLGYFDDINDAIAARAAANIKHGFSKNHGR